MYDYTYLEARVVWRDDYGVCIAGTCTLCDKRFFRTGQTEKNAWAGVRLLYRNHKTADKKPCLAGVISHAYRSTEVTRARDRGYYVKRKQREEGRK